MPQYMPGSEAFVDAVLEREKSRSIEYICFDFEKPFLYQVNWNYPGVFSSDFHRRQEYSHDSDFIGVWILKYK